AGHGHGVRGELTAARARSGTGRGFDGFELFICDLAGSMRADGFENVLNRDVDDRAVSLLQLAGRNGSSEKHESRNIQPAHGHDGTGHVFVTTGDTNNAVKEIAARDQLYRVG